MKCWKCEQEQDHNGWFCINKECNINLYAHHSEEDDIRRRPLTDHEKLKLSWYRDEKKWVDNIRSRQVKDGVVISNQGVMPKQPTQFYKNGGRTR